MTFAGDMPEGGHAQLMRANVDRLVDGAVGAARATFLQGAQNTGARAPDQLRRKADGVAPTGEEEIEAVREVFGGRTVLAGFYSYGEIAPAIGGGPCELHNQTMTLATFSEA